MLFIMDCTGSMQSWIDATKNELFNIINAIKEEFTSILIRVGFVGYRDFCDKNLPPVLYPFSEDIESVKKYISQ